MSYYINIENCDACGACMEVCMNNAILDFYDFFLIDPNWCAECGSCNAFCTRNAIEYNGLGSSSILATEPFELIEYYNQL